MWICKFLNLNMPTVCRGEYMPTNYAENAHKVLQKKISPSSRIVGMSTVHIYYVILIGKRGEWDAHWDFLVMPRKEETHFRII